MKAAIKPLWVGFRHPDDDQPAAMLEKEYVRAGTTAPVVITGECWIRTRGDARKFAAWLTKAAGHLPVRKP